MMIVADFTIATYFLGCALWGTLFNGFENILEPVRIWDLFRYAALPASLFVFSGFLFFATVKSSPYRAPFMALFAVGLFDSVCSVSSVLWGAPVYFSGITENNVATWLLFIVPALLLFNEPPNRKAITMLLALVGAVLVYQLSLNFIDERQLLVDFYLTFQLTPMIVFQRVLENVIEVGFCAVALEWFRPRLPAATPRASLSPL